MSFLRYIYLRKIWKDNHGIEEGTLKWKISMQQEIFVQCLANMGLLSTPMFLQAFGYSKGGMSDFLQTFAPYSIKFTFLLFFFRNVSVGNRWLGHVGLVHSF